MKRPLTEKQKQILRYIARHIDRLGFQPSYQEIAERFRLGHRSAAAAHLRALERKGVVMLNGESRAVAFRWKLWCRKRSRK